ncbi:MAG TPA: ABC transporter substrate-binding protein [Candidatus Acidoferrum sp.]|jgi:ABC-type nitrate/sulfonate/bicarbonate transport system substrate-binding protein|nr:ABC transporter substrate-binding protein [Candidatus Acidoferrum sp.]
MIAWLVLLQTALTIAVAGPPTSPEYLPLHVAQADGLFTAQQLSVTLRSTRSDAAAAEMLATGQAQLAATSLDAALRLGGTEGVPPRLVWALTAAPPVALLVAPGRVDTIRSAADLAGQTVAIPAPGTTEDQALGLLLARAGVPMHRVKVLSLGERGVARALEGGEVAAGVLGEPHVSRLVEGGKAVIAVDLRTAKDAAATLGGPTVGAALFARAGAEPPAATIRALRAALQAAVGRTISAEPAALQTTLPSAVIGSPADFALRLRSARDLFLADGRVPAETLERSLELLRARAPLPAKVKLPKKADRLLIE